MKALDLAAVQSLAEKHASHKGNLITLLQEIQRVFGYLPEDSLKIVSNCMKIPMSRIYGIATFYSQFHLKPRGRNIICVCRGTACHIKGGKTVLETLQKQLGISDGETTPDYRFTLETASCLGACAMGSVVMIGNTYHGRMTPTKIESLVNSLP